MKDSHEAAWMGKEKAVLRVAWLVSCLAVWKVVLRVEKKVDSTVFGLVGWREFQKVVK